MHRAFFEKVADRQRRDFTTPDILRSIEQTVPLAAIARDQIEALKHWAAEAGARTASKDSHLVEELNIPYSGESDRWKWIENRAF
jgi:hypothetical protein